MFTGSSEWINGVFGVGNLPLWITKAIFNIRQRMWFRVVGLSLVG